MITINSEPEGLLLRKADVMKWLRGLTDEEWDRVRPQLTPVRLPGCRKPYYRRIEVRSKIVEPLLKDQT